MPCISDGNYLFSLRLYVQHCPIKWNTEYPSIHLAHCCAIFLMLLCGWWNRFHFVGQLTSIPQHIYSSGFNLLFPFHVQMVPILVNVWCKYWNFGFSYWDDVNAFMRYPPFILKRAQCNTDCLCLDGRKYSCSWFLYSVFCILVAYAALYLYRCKYIFWTPLMRLLISVFWLYERKYCKRARLSLYGGNCRSGLGGNRIDYNPPRRRFVPNSDSEQIRNPMLASADPLSKEG